MAQVYNDVLLIKHLPDELTTKDKEDLLKHFGAVDTKCIEKGPLKKAAFAKFSSNLHADKALKSLHQLKILGSVLNVEYSRKAFDDILVNYTADFIQSRINILNNEKVTNARKSEKPDLLKIQQDIDSLSEKWNIRYRINENLRYSYPPPDVNIIRNITNALISVPKFYTQVLHLMNKMNLPAPFGTVSATPPLLDAPPVTTELHHTQQLPNLSIQNEEMDISSSEESELESESEEKGSFAPKMAPDVKRKLKSEHKKIAKKRIKLMSVIPELPKSQTVITAEEVFEKTSTDLQKKPLMKFGELRPVLGTENSWPVSENGEENSANEDKTLSEGTGFGKIEPVNIPQHSDSEDSGEDGELSSKEFISSRTLRKGCLSSKEMKDFTVFKNYQVGEPNTRLYVKNLAKQTTEKDLHHIYGKYVNWDKEIEKNMFDIRLMKEGRMKGQCFVTLGNTKKAEQALQDTNAYMLHGKPMVVQFARSAKPKETQS